MRVPRRARLHFLAQREYRKGANRSTVRHPLADDVPRDSGGYSGAGEGDGGAALLAVPEELIALALEQELAEQTVTADSVAGTPCVFLSGLYHAEQSVAGHLRRVTGGPVPWPGDRRGQGAAIPVLTQHYVMLQRNLLYTGITRGKRLVVLVGQRKALAIAVKNVSGRRRCSKLDEWLGVGA